MTQFARIYVACLCLGLAAAAAAGGVGATGAQFGDRFRELLDSLRSVRCGGTSATATTLLRSPPADAARSAGDCTYTIRARTRRVCQLRIDIDTLELAQPATTVDRPYPHCGVDALLVDGLALELCGHNVGQHVYVPWNVQRLRDTKRITVRTATRQQGGSIPPATWRLRVTQIECAEKRAILPASMFGQRKDAALRAPAGCLQYFAEASGTVESFNLNRRQGPYLGALSYGICFRRRPQDSELRLQAEFFEMSQSVATGAGYDADCTAHVITPQAREDFLAVREAQFTTANVRMVANRFCGTSIAAQQNITTSAPGPFMMQFSSDQQYSLAERGFRFHYSVV